MPAPLPSAASAPSGPERLTVVFRGVRGSFVTPGPRFVRYGGHTTCHEILAGRRRLILDAGSGLIGLGDDLVAGGPEAARTALMLSHTHWDHLAGLLFFAPVYHPATRLTLFGPRAGGTSLRELLQLVTDRAFHPVPFDAMPMKAEIVELAGGEMFRWRPDGETLEAWPEGLRGAEADPEDLVVRTLFSARHPLIGVLHFRVEWRGATYVFATDTEGDPDGDPVLAAFARGADLLAHDGQYTAEEYARGAPPKRGWGHSTVEMAAATARRAGVRRLAVIHHNPAEPDEIVDARAAAAAGLHPDLFFAREGERVPV